MLAQRLNELAVSHDQGLLDDDEYRLLRQDVFERYAANPVIPVELPLVPTAATRKKQVEFAPEQSPSSLPSDPSRSKPSIVANLLRRATRRKSKESLTPSVQVDTAPVISLKRSFLPRSLTRKSSFDKNSLSSSTSLGSSKTFHSGFFSSPPTSPPSLISPSSPSSSWPSSQRKPSSTLNSKSASKLNVSTPMLDHDIFEDGGLHTTKDIRKAIIDLEAEGKRVVEAFDQLEQSTIAKVQQRERDEAYKTLPSSSRSNSNPDHQSSDAFYSSSSLAVPKRLRSGSIASANSAHSKSSYNTPSSPISRPRKLSASSNVSTSAAGPGQGSAGASYSHGHQAYGIGNNNATSPGPHQIKHKSSISSIVSSPGSLLSVGRSKSNNSNKNGGHHLLSRSTSQSSMSQHQHQSQSQSQSKTPGSTLMNRRNVSNPHPPSHSHSHSLSRSSSHQSQSRSHSRSGSRSGSRGLSPSSSTSALNPMRKVSSSSSSAATMVVLEHGRISEVLLEGDGEPEMELGEEAHEKQEVLDVQRRKMEVIARYEAQIEYLRARLKGAELHERLLRK
ncbi:hypothetical protein VKT23_006888 [Stygiomarasmius scandens]|uniref:Uncharacterized protein n=1 Tax=Marasmiellus scandens TaxID=2682957 RepID=A0ABR1JRR6_9AGAR